MLYNTNMNYILVQTGSKNMYLKEHVDFTISPFNNLTSLVMNSLRSSSVLWSLFVKFLLIRCQIFSAGFNSGLYGGRKTRIMFSGIMSFIALWNAPLSSTTIFNSFELEKENSFKNTWKLALSHRGISKTKWSPFIGEKAP